MSMADIVIPIVLALVMSLIAWSTNPKGWEGLISATIIFFVMLPIFLILGFIL